MDKDVHKQNGGLSASAQSHLTSLKWVFSACPLEVIISSCVSPASKKRSGWE